MNQVIAPLRKRPPLLSKAQVNALLIQLTGRSRLDIGRFKELPSYADRNYHFQLQSHLESDQGNPLQAYKHTGQKIQSYILKILSCPDQESYDLACARIGVMRNLHIAGLKCPNLIKLKNQDLMQTVQLSESHLQCPASDIGENTFIAYLLTFIEGQTLATIRPSNNLLYRIGKYAGLLAKNLQNFSDDRLKKNKSVWSIHSFGGLKSYIKYSQPDRQDILERIYDRCYRYFQDNANNLRSTIIHNDISTYNIIVRPNNQTNDYDIAGIIDFGEVDHAYVVNELAIMIYNAIWIVDKDPIDAAGYLIAGFDNVFPLTQTEYTGIFTSVLARLFQSITVVDYHISCFPENEYLRDSYDQKLKIFKLLSTIPESNVYKIWDEVKKKCNTMMT